MTKIYILGTSNSVVGTRGYAEALGLQHEVINRSSARSTFVYHIFQILQNRAEIEACDLLIIDHYGNDANFYYGFFGEQYPEYLELLYQLLATLNLPVLNLMFPRLSHAYPEARGLVLEIAAKYGITSLDLNDSGFRPEHFMDEFHLDRYASYMMGIFLSQSLARGIDSRPVGGVLIHYPLRVISAREIAPDLPLHSFKNRVSRFEYVKLDRERRLTLAEGEKVISVGYFRDFKESLNQGFVLDRKPYGVSAEVSGFLHEMTPITCGVLTSIAPIVGTHDQIEILARGDYISGDFTQPCLTDLIVQNSVATFSGCLASREVFKVTMEGLVSAIDAASAKVQSRLSEASLAPAPPMVWPATIDYLRDTALAQSDAELDRAIDLMELARFFRPQGQLIATNLEELHRKRADAPRQPPTTIALKRRSWWPF